MKKIKYLSSFIFAFCIGFIIMNYNGNEMATNVTNNDKEKKVYYKDYDGNFWENKYNYESYRNEDYYKAPDGTYWANEYRYELSKSK